MSGGLSFDYKYGIVLQFLTAYKSGKVRILEDDSPKAIIDSLGESILSDVRGTRLLGDYYKREFTDMIFERILELRIRGQLEGSY